MSERLVESLRRLAGEIEADLRWAREEGWAAGVKRYENAMEAEGIGKYLRERIHDAVTRGWWAGENSITSGAREAERARAVPIEEAIRDARAAEREACARVLDGMADKEHQGAWACVNRDAERLMMLAVSLARRGAAAIRARGGACAANPEGRTSA